MLQERVNNISFHFISKFLKDEEGFKVIALWVNVEKGIFLWILKFLISLFYSSQIKNFFSRIGCLLHMNIDNAIQKIDGWVQRLSDCPWFYPNDYQQLQKDGVSFEMGDCKLVLPVI